MSIGSLQRTGTEWLDLSDKNIEANANFPVSQQLENTDSQRENWETILEGVQESSTDVDRPERGHDSPSDGPKKSCNTQSCNIQRQGTENEAAGCGSIRRCLYWSFGELCPFFKKLRYTDIGSGRWLRDERLVAIRLIMLMITAVSLGLAFGMRDRVPHKYLALELFTWLHLFSVSSVLSLLMGSLWLLRGKIAMAEQPNKRTSWAVVGMVSQTLNTLSQTELLRLIGLVAVPSLQPATLAPLAARELYSFNSPFAIQRYVLVFTGTIELLFSRLPQRLSYVPIAVFISTVWNITLFLIRDSTATFVTRLTFLIGSIVIVIALSLINIFIHRRLCTESSSSDVEAGSNV